MSNREGYNKKYYHNHKEYFKKYHDEHKEEIKKKRIEYFKQYRQKNRKEIAKHQREYYLNNRISVIERHYNLSYGAWLEMWESQNGKCAICEKVFDSPSDACVDHNHETGEIRGLLCIKCNYGLGQFNDNLQLLENAIEYLISNQG